MLKRVRGYSALLAVLATASPALAASDRASVSGVVRDASGAPQMGVMVELLHEGVVATAFTDLHGRYHIDQLSPGFYDLETSAALFLPTLKRRLRLSAGGMPIVNLTLSGLFDESGWLSSPSHPAGGNLEDWKWTLRSPANRPMLRLVDDQEPLSGATEQRPTPALAWRHATLRTTTAAGSFGGSGTRMEGEVRRQDADYSRRQVVRVAAGREAGPGQTSPFSVTASSMTSSREGMQRRLVAAMRAYPQIETTGGSGLELLEFDSAQQMEMGSMAALEVGASSQLMHSGGTLMVVRPFAQLSVHPAGSWLVRYHYATAPQRQGIETLGEDGMDAPTVIRGRNGRLGVPSGTHQEAAVGRSVGRVRLQIAAFHDTQHNATLNGQMSRHVATVSGTQLAGLAVDTANGTFRSFAQGFSSTGTRVAMDTPFGSTGTITAVYFNGIGLADQAVAAKGTGIFPRRVSAVCVIVKKSLPGSGTEVAASYRWQGASMLTTIGAYDMPGTSPYLGVHLSQRLPLARLGAVLTVDGANLLAEGYRQTPEIAGQDAVLMSAVREIRAGLAVTF